MKTLLITHDKSIEDYVKEAKEHLDKEGVIELRAESRETVRAVDVAELLKREHYHVKAVDITTEEKEVSMTINGKTEAKKIRTSVMKIDMHK